MRVLVRFLIASVIAGFTASASANFIQRFDFYAGFDLTADPFSWAEIVFPQQSGCVSGQPFFLPPLDCSLFVPGGDTNTADEISITGPLGDGVFNVGLWSINDDGLLEVLGLSFTNAQGAPVGISGSAIPFSLVPTPFPTENPVSVLGGWVADIGGPQLVGGAIIAAPIPSPSTLLLIGGGILGFATIRQRLVKLHC